MPEVFWSYFAERILRVGVTLRHASQPPLGEVVPNSFFVRLAADILEHPVPIVVVLDGADRLVSRGATAGLDFLIGHAFPQFRLVMCGRADPQLPLHKYRLTDSMTELRRDALAFTVAEARLLLASLGAKVPRDIAAALTEQTEGWAAGLRLAALSLKQGQTRRRSSIPWRERTGVLPSICLPRSWRPKLRGCANSCCGPA